MIKSCQFNFRFDVLFVCLNVTHLDFMIILLSVDYFEIIFQQSHKVTWWGVFLCLVDLFGQFFVVNVLVW